MFHVTVTQIYWLSFITDSVNLDVSMDYFQKYIFHLFDVFFPLRKVRVRDEQPWRKLSLKLFVNESEYFVISSSENSYARKMK